MPSKDELKLLQAYPLDLKIMKTKQRIREWVDYYGSVGVYVSFSGGKDSTVLLHIVRSMFPDIEAVFVDTGLEYPEIRSFVKSFDNVTILRPKMRFDEVIKEYGYPLISKETSNCLYLARVRNSKHRLTKLNGEGNYGSGSIFNAEKWKPLLSVDFIIGDMCCLQMKKKPLREFEKSGKFPIIATMAEESKRRENGWLKSGCNAFDGKIKRSAPLSFWTEQDILQYIKEYNLPIASVYGEVVYGEKEGEQYDNLLCDCGGKLCTTGCSRTGCIFCGFGAHLTPKNEESRFQRLKKTHPRQYEYCLGGGAYDTDGLWKPTKDGLGMKHCIDTLNEIYGKDFIRY